MSPLTHVRRAAPLPPYLLTAAEWLRGDGRDPGAVRARNGRLAGLLFILADLYGQLVLPSLAEPRAGLRWAELLGWVGAALMLVLPWRRLPAWVSALPSVGAVALLSAGTGGMSGALEHFGAVYGLLFAYTGLTMRPGRTSAVAALAVAGVAGAAVLGRQDGGLVQVVATIVITATVGELTALAFGAHRHAQVELNLLNASLGRLVAASTESEAAQLTAALAQQLLVADGVMVILAEEPGSQVLVGRGGVGLGGDTTSVRIDSAVEQSGVGTAVRSGAPLFVADAPTSPLFARRFIDSHRVASILYIPVPGEGGTLGVIAVWWSRPRRSLDPFGRQVLTMLSTQAGHVLGRLRTVCALDVAAGTDSLTGLANRRAWDAALAGLPLGGAVVLFDLDEFKPVNDTHGHAVGDVVLRTFAATLHGCVRDGDLVVRLGGDEFGILLPSGGESGARLVLDRLAERWGSPHGVAYSTGSAVLRPDETAEQAMLRADAALYGDKRAGHRLG